MRREVALPFVFRHISFEGVGLDASWYEERNKLLSSILKQTPNVGRLELHSGNKSICGGSYPRICKCEQVYNQSLKRVAALPIRHLEHIVTENVTTSDSILIALENLPEQLESLCLSSPGTSDLDDDWSDDGPPQFAHMEDIADEISSLPNLRLFEVKNICTASGLAGGDYFWSAPIETLDLEFAHYALPIKSQDKMQEFFTFLSSFKDSLRKLRL